MSQSDEINQAQNSAQPHAGAKKPYHKPEVRYEKVFETQALTCGKVQTTQASCHSNRKLS
jgi:hypothetical protein